MLFLISISCIIDQKKNFYGEGIVYISSQNQIVPHNIIVNFLFNDLKTISNYIDKIYYSIGVKEQFIVKIISLQIIIFYVFIYIRRSTQFSIKQQNWERKNFFFLIYNMKSWHIYYIQTIEYHTKKSKNLAPKIDTFDTIRIKDWYVK